MRLRQVALASYDLDGVVAALDDIFGLKVAYNDPGVGHYGLKNAVLPAGKGFIEVVQPIADNASAGRFLAKEGGDAGYMLIFQVPDADAETKRVEAKGVRVVDKIDRPYYACSHFHPKDFGGVLASFDQQKTETDYMLDEGDWMPAGPDWQKAKSDEVTDLAGATLTQSGFDALAEQWSDLLGRPLKDSAVQIDAGEVRFAPSDSARTSLAEVLFKVRDPAAVKARAEASGLPVQDGAVKIGGVWFRYV